MVLGRRRVGGRQLRPAAQSPGDEPESPSHQNRQVTPIITMRFCWPSRQFSCRQLVDDHRTVNMKLRFKVMLLLTVLFAVLGIAQWIVQQRILLPGFADLERQAARNDTGRATNDM